MLRGALFRRAGAAAGLVLGGGALLSARSRLEETPATSALPVSSTFRALLGRPSAAACEAAPTVATGPNGMPIYTKAEVARHTGGEAGVWVTLGNKVYDITTFIANHPGGVEKIRLAAGGSLEPYWALYRQHVQTTDADGSIVPKDHVAEQLASLQVGWLDPADVAREKSSRSADDPYVNEPARHPALISVSEVPCSAELPREFLIESWLTPAALW